MTSHFTAVETAAKKWFNDRILTDTESQIASMITKLSAAEKELIAKEKGKDAKKHADKAKADSEKLDKEIVKAQAAAETAKKDVEAKEKALKAARDAYNKVNKEFKSKSDELSALGKQIAGEKDAKKKAALQKTKDLLVKEVDKLNVQKSAAEKDRVAAYEAREDAKEVKLNKEKAVGLKRREKWLLRSVELRDVIDGLEKDKKIVADFKVAATKIKMPKVV